MSVRDGRTGADHDEPGSLGGLGLTPAEEAAYELLVDLSPATLTELRLTWDRPEPLADVLTTMERRDLVSREPGGDADGDADRYAAVPPEVAFGTLLRDRKRQIQEARGHVEQLAASYRGLADAPRSLQVEEIRGQQAIDQRLAALLNSVRHELRCLHSTVGLSESDASVATGLDLLTRGITCRAVYEHDAIQAPGALDRVEQLAAAGAQVCTLPALPGSVLLADDRFALVAVEGDPADVPVALVVYPGGMFDALSALFEALWDRAASLHLSDEGHPTATSWQPGHGRWTDNDRRLVALMLSGSTDEALARQLGIGYRTAARRIATLMTDLGARTRFQAGVQAALRTLPPHRNDSPH